MWYASSINSCINSVKARETVDNSAVNTLVCYSELILRKIIVVSQPDNSKHE